MNMREAWKTECEKYNLNPDFNPIWKAKFEAGYAAAIEAVKAGGPVAWVITLYDEPVSTYFNKDEAELEFKRRNKQYPEPTRQFHAAYKLPEEDV
jgi:hypothetical protein